VRFAAITLCTASQRVFIIIIIIIIVVVVVYFVSTQSGNFWIYSRTSKQPGIVKHLLEPLKDIRMCYLENLK
jgi:hypothetical protein